MLALKFLCAYCSRKTFCATVGTLINFSQTASGMFIPRSTGMFQRPVNVKDKGLSEKLFGKKDSFYFIIAHFRPTSFTIRQQLYI